MASTQPQSPATPHDGLLFGEADRRKHVRYEMQQAKVRSNVGKTIGLVGASGLLGLGAVALASQLAQAGQPHVYERPGADAPRAISATSPFVGGGSNAGGLPTRPSHEGPEPTGDLRVGRALTLDFNGPMASERDLDPNPFLDYRLQVRFIGPSGQVFDVPGFFAGDGAVGVTPATAVDSTGDQWRVRFAPDEAGAWTWEAELRQGENVAIDLDALAGEAWPGFEVANGESPFGGRAPRTGDAGQSARVGGARNTVTGAFDVAALDPQDDGFFKYGRLVYDGTHYLSFTHGPSFIKGGVDSPENWLGYYGFDNTSSANTRGPSTPDNLHRFPTHIMDWEPGDPDWDSPDTPEPNDGRNIIGALNYLSGAGVNSIYFMPMNIGGDAQDTWPYADPTIDGAGNAANNNLNLDLSKLNQWEIVFEHAQRKGLMLHVVLGEAETDNKLELDDAQLGLERMLFYRELVARFGHHNALVWNLSEEYNLGLNLGSATVLGFADYVKMVDPYDHPVTVHNAGNPSNTNNGPWAPFIGQPEIDLTSLQWAQQLDGLGELVENYRDATTAAGKPLPVMIDEPGSPTRDAGNDLDEFRQRVIYDVLFSGGNGEWFINNVDQSLEDFRDFDQLWRDTGTALRFMNENLPFTEMRPADELMFFDDNTFGGAEVLAKDGAVYACYFPDAGGLGGSDTAGILDFISVTGTFETRWFNPRTGQFEGQPSAGEGGQPFVIGEPPTDANNDWIALITLVNLEDCDGDGIPDCRCFADLAGPAGSLTPDGVVTIDDFQAYLGLWSLGDLRADVTGPGSCDIATRDGAIDLTDFSCYLMLWSMGCP